MEGWVGLGVGYIPRCFTCSQTVVTHPGINHLIATRPGVEPTTIVTIPSLYLMTGYHGHCMTTFTGWMLLSGFSSEWLQQFTSVCAAWLQRTSLNCGRLSLRQQVVVVGFGPPQPAIWSQGFIQPPRRGGVLPPWNKCTPPLREDHQLPPQGEYLFWGRTKFVLMLVCIDDWTDWSLYRDVRLD